MWFRVARLGFRFVDAECLGVAYRRTQGSLVTGAPAAQLESLFDVFERAEQPDPTVVGHGPLPTPSRCRPSPSAYSRRQQVLRYVALIAATDTELAVAEGVRGLPPIVRRTIDVEAELPALRDHAVAWLALAGPEGGGLRGGAARRAHSPRPASRRGVETVGRSDDVGAADWRSHDVLLARARQRRSEPPPTSSTGA